MSYNEVIKKNVTHVWRDDGESDHYSLCRYRKITQIGTVSRWFSVITQRRIHGGGTCPPPPPPSIYKFITFRAAFYNNSCTLALPTDTRTHELYYCTISRQCCRDPLKIKGIVASSIVWDRHISTTRQRQHCIPGPPIRDDTHPPPPPPPPAPRFLYRA